MVFNNDWICIKCKYRVAVSGNVLKGMLGDVSRVYCFVCMDCKIVQDIFWDEIPREEICCKDCKGKNLIKWDGRCPKCDSEMESSFLIRVYNNSLAQY